MSRPADFDPHFTVAAVTEENGRFLAVHEYVNGVERINNPAGHVEDGESPQAAVIREMREETGYRFVPECLGGIYIWRHPGSGATFVRCNLIGHCDGRDAGAQLDVGIIGPRWYSLEELENRKAILRSPLVARSFREYVDGIRYPLDVVTTLIER